MDVPAIRHDRTDHRGAFVMERDGTRLTENVKIIPLCPFAKSLFDKTPRFADVLAA